MMNFRDFAIGVAVGLATAVLVKEVSDRTLPYKSANEVLASIKEQFKKDGPIDGSWVYMKPEQYDNGYMSTPVYRGGISQLINGQSKTFEFVADAFNGIILDVKEA